MKYFLHWNIFNPLDTGPPATSSNKAAGTCWFHSLILFEKENIARERDVLKLTKLKYDLFHSLLLWNIQLNELFNWVILFFYDQWIIVMNYSKLMAAILNSEWLKTRRGLLADFLRSGRHSDLALAKVIWRNMKTSNTSVIDVNIKLQRKLSFRYTLWIIHG